MSIKGDTMIISLSFRIALILVSIITAVFFVKKIRNSKLQIEYSIYWLLFAGVVILLSLFPELTVLGANLLGIYSSTNFVFLVILFALILKIFYMTIEISNLEYKIKELSQKIAIDEYKKEKEAGSDEE